MSDRITLTGLRVRGRHGVLPEERRDGQDFVVDVELAVDVRAAAEADDLARTVDYGGLAERLAQVCLEDERVERVEVTVHKPQAPIAVPFEDVSVTVVRP